MKEVIGLIIQAIALGGMFYVINRQLNDLWVQEDDAKKQYTKNVLFAGMSIAALLCSVGLFRLLHILLIGHTTDLLDDMAFWASRLIYLEISIAGFFLYKGNKRVI